MPVKTKHAYLLALLLVAVVLAAQLHCCCGELNANILDSHVCPICPSAGAAIATPSPNLAMAPAMNRLEVFRITPLVPVVVLRNIAPRAPPVS